MLFPLKIMGNSLIKMESNWKNGAN
jgi:hypothetical protein